MTIYTIPKDSSLDHVWTFLVYEEGRLLTHNDAADLAPDAGQLLARWAIVNEGQRAVWRTEILAQARVDGRDDKMDDTVIALDDELLRSVPDRDSARYRRYFKQPRHEIVRLGLESEIEEVRTWPGSLKTEPEPPLQALGVALEADVAAGEDAVRQRQFALAATADHRVREVNGFIDEVNAARRTRYATLIQRADERGLPKSWPQRFFRKGPSPQKKASPQPKPKTAQVKTAPA